MKPEISIARELMMHDDAREAPLQGLGQENLSQNLLTAARKS